MFGVVCGIRASMEVFPFLCSHYSLLMSSILFFWLFVSSDVIRKCNSLITHALCFSHVLNSQVLSPEKTFGVVRVIRVSMEVLPFLMLIIY